MANLTEQQKQELEMALAPQDTPIEPLEAAPAGGIPQYMQDRYESSSEDDYLAQAMENARANIAGRGAVNIGNTSGDLRKAEIEEYLKQAKGEPKAKSNYQLRKGMIDKDTGLPIVFDSAEGIPKYWDESAGKFVASSNPIVRKKPEGSKKKKGRDLTSKEVEKLTSSESLLTQIDELSGMSGNIEPSFWKSMYNDIADSVTGGRAVSDEYLDTKAAITNLTAEIRHKLAGSAVSASEKKFLEGMLPEISRSPKDFKTKMARFKKRFTQALKDYKAGLKGAGRVWDEGPVTEEEAAEVTPAVENIGGPPVLDAVPEELTPRQKFERMKMEKAAAAARL
jgi:hypothetical protein